MLPPGTNSAVTSLTLRPGFPFRTVLTQCTTFRAMGVLSHCIREMAGWHQSSMASLSEKISETCSGTLMPCRLQRVHDLDQGNG